MSTSAVAGAPLIIRSSRIWGLLRLNLMAFFFPARMSGHVLADALVAQRRAPAGNHVAEIEVDRGLIWDALRIESSGGIDPLQTDGLSKFHSGSFVERLRAVIGRQRMIPEKWGPVFG